MSQFPNGTNIVTGKCHHTKCMPRTKYQRTILMKYRSTCTCLTTKSSSKICLGWQTLPKNTCTGIYDVIVMVVKDPKHTGIIPTTSYIYTKDVLKWLPEWEPVSFIIVLYDLMYSLSLICSFIPFDYTVFVVSGKVGIPLTGLTTSVG